MNNFHKIEEQTDGSEYLKFGRVENKRSSRPDLHAFLLLDELFPDDEDMIADAAHDQFYIGITSEQIDSISYSDALELVRSGVVFDSEYECLYMFT